VDEKSFAASISQGAIMEKEIDAVNNEITIVDIDISFSRAVLIILKWMLASIPAVIVFSIILFIMSLFISLFIGGFFASLFSQL
jgi:hypothetical protein